MKVSMQNSAGFTRKVKVGISWTALFFGSLPFFFRGMPKHGVIWLLFSIITLSISNLILIFTMNKMTARYYLERGYRPVGPGWDTANAKWGIATAVAQSAVA